MEETNIKPNPRSGKLGMVNEDDDDDNDDQEFVLEQTTATLVCYANLTPSGC